MKKRKLITIIIPTLNSMATIERCLSSAREQSYGEIEIVVVDGYSTDGTYEYLASQKDLHLFQTDRGVSRQRNLGIEKANGSFIFFLDSDDVIASDAIERLYDSITDNDIAIPSIFLFYVDEDIPTNTQRVHGQLCKELLNHTDFFAGGHASCVHGPTKLYRKSIIGRCRFDETIQYGEDTLFNYSIYLENPKIKFICDPRARYYYRKSMIENPATKRAHKEVLLFFLKFMKIYRQTHSQGLLSMIFENYCIFRKAIRCKSMVLFRTKMFLIVHLKGTKSKLKIAIDRI